MIGKKVKRILTLVLVAGLAVAMVSVTLLVRDSFMAPIVDPLQDSPRRSAYADTEPAANTEEAWEEGQTEEAEQVEEAVREEIPEVYDVVIHIEPTGSAGHQREEHFGLTPESVVGGAALPKR